MKRIKICRTLFLIVVAIMNIFSNTTMEAHAYTNANVEAVGDLTHIAIARMGRKYGWTDSYIAKINDSITYKITGINDSRSVRTTVDAGSYGITNNTDTQIIPISDLTCKQGHGDAYILAFEQVPTCTTDGWVIVGCGDCEVSSFPYHNFIHVTQTSDGFIDNSSHHFFYQELLGHDYDYNTWTYANNNGITKGMRYHKCKYCDAYTDLQYGCWVRAGTGISSVAGQNWYNAGSTVTLTAIPQAGYTWSKWTWTGNGSSTNKTFSFTINRAYEFKATASANKYSIHFDANGGEGYMDDMVLTYDIPQKLPTNAFTRNNSYGDSKFLGWNIIADTREVLYTDGAEVVNATEIDGSTLTLYAVWDDCPWINADDLYYPLKDAQSGLITYDELISHATAFDREDSENISSGIDEETGTSFTIIDYQPTDFTIFNSAGSVTETFQVVDSTGNSYTQTITVYIVDTEPKVVKPDGTTRFINEKYYYETFENGGLEDNSIWKTDPEYISVITQTFENSKNSTPIMSFHFGYEEILQMKQFIHDNGIGNGIHEDALERFYVQFMKSNMVN